MVEELVTKERDRMEGWRSSRKNLTNSFSKLGEMKFSIACCGDMSCVITFDGAWMFNFSLL